MFFAQFILPLYFSTPAIVHNEITHLTTVKPCVFNLETESKLESKLQLIGHTARLNIFSRITLVSRIIFYHNTESNWNKAQS